MSQFALLASLFLVVALGASANTIHILANCTHDRINALNNARDALRALQPRNTTATVTVIGTCAAPFALDAEQDSGTAAAPIVYQGLTPDSGLSGGVKVAWSLFQKTSLTTTSGLPIFSINLTEAKGLHASDFGNFANGGLSACGHTIMQLFVDGVPMTVARTPNAHGEEPPERNQRPWREWLFPKSLAKNETLSFYFSPDDNSSLSTVSSLKRIAAAFAQSKPPENVWAHGYWAYDWADNYVRVANFTAESSTAGSQYLLAVDPATPPVYSITCGRHAGRFYLVNHISFLDAPGEYYIDASQGVMYFAPPVADMTGRNIVLSTSSGPLLSATGATPLSYVTFKTLSISYGRSDALAFPSANHVTLSELRVEGFTQGGVTVEGEHVTVEGSLVNQIGCSAVSVGGGDPRWLSSSHNVVSNNTVTNFARLTRCYSRGVFVYGVGANVASNFISNAPHQGVSASGNNHNFTSNVFSNLCYGTIDAAAFYIGRSWINRGMHLTDNFFVNITIREPVTETSTMVSAIYWDDQQSGCTATGNTMRNVDNCFLVGGGRDNLIDGNICEESLNFAVYIDNRGMNWQKEMCTPPQGQLVEQLFSVNFTSPPYSIAYPSIVTTLTNHPCVPVGNRISNNRYRDCKGGFMSVSESTIQSWYSIASNNTLI